MAWNWADEFAFDFLAVLWFGDHWASLWWAHARAAWAAHRADEWRRASDDVHCQLWLLLHLLFGVVGRADRAVHMFAAFRSFRFRASFGNLCAGTAWARLRADDFHSHRLLLLFGVVRLADRAEANKCAACRSFRFRASLGGLFTGAAWARRRAVGRDGDFHHRRYLLLFFRVMRANWAMADTFAAFRSFRFRASFGDFHAGAARKGRRADEFHRHRLLLLFGVVGRADRAVADTFAAFGSFRYRASFGNFLAGAARKGRRAIGRDSDRHHWFRLLLFLGVVRLADRAEANKCAVCRSFRFRASFGDFHTGTTGKGGWASGIRFHRGFSEFHFEVFDAFVRADERAFEQLAMVGSFNWRTTLGRAFARTTWARRRANLLLEG